MAGATTRGRIFTALLLATFVASVVFSVVSGDATDVLQHRMSRVVVAGGLVTVSGICFFAGLGILLAIAAPQLLAGSRRDADASYPRRFAEGVRSIFVEAPDHRWFMLGWTLNSIGVIAPVLVMTVFVLTTFPASSWGLAVAPAVDFVVTCVLRVSLHRRILRVRQERSAARARVVEADLHR